MSKPIWMIRQGIATMHKVVCRYDREIAEIVEQPAGMLKWNGIAFRLERVGFQTERDILDDVKYFYRESRRPEGKVGRLLSVGGRRLLSAP